MEIIANNKIRKVLLILYFSGLVLLPLVLIILPADFFDDSRTPMCLSVILFHRTCFGCGITRACMHMLHFDFTAAWHFNKLSVIVLPLLIFGLVEELLRMRKKIKMSWEVE